MLRKKDRQRRHVSPKNLTSWRTAKPFELVDVPADILPPLDRPRFDYDI